MRSPWIDLPLNPPYVLASDMAVLNDFNANASLEHKYDFSLLPEPYLGSANASVVILNLNPGWSPDDLRIHSDPYFSALIRRSLNYRLESYPFLHLRPDVDTPGSRWWRRRTHRLTEEVGFENISSNLACIEFYPYHSPRFSATSPRIPSQDYSFYLVRQAISRKAEIVIMRSIKLWINAVPELGRYDRLHLGVNPRAPFISPGNLKHSYTKIVDRLRGIT